jgi:hypothetical protein
MKQEIGNRQQGVGLCVVSRSVAMGKSNDEESNLHIVRKTVGSVSVGVVREGSTGRVVTIVPRLWAVAEPSRKTALPLEADPAHAQDARINGAPVPVVVEPQPEVAFYRKYTEALLRRYLRMSTEVGRVPSLLGRELFRGHVTSYKVKSFEDVVIFCYDVEKCLKVLDARECELIKRIALQAYSKAEAAAILGISLRWCVVKYAAALDKLTHELLQARMLNPLEPCQ